MADTPHTFKGVPKPGEVLAGKYRVERVLGAGGMGVVVAARHLHLDQQVAMKFLLAEAARTEANIERFSREAQAAARIKSDHVARVTDIGTLESGSPYMVMEYLEGEDLSEVIDRGPVPIQQAVEYLMQAAQGLAAAHHAGIVHRDLKPANLFVETRADGSHHVKVLDFGISKITSPDKNRKDLTQTSAMMGSPSYMAPEQMKSAKTADARADIWAFGAILFELISTVRPFDGDTLLEVASKILQDDPPRLRDIVPAVPPGLQAAIFKCLEKDPNLRHQNLAHLAYAIAPYGGPAAKRGARSIRNLLDVPEYMLPSLDADPDAPTSGPAGVPSSDPSVAETGAFVQEQRLALQTADNVPALSLPEPPSFPQPEPASRPTPVPLSPHGNETVLGTPSMPGRPGVGGFPAATAPGVNPLTTQPGGPPVMLADLIGPGRPGGTQAALAPVAPTAHLDADRGSYPGRGGPNDWHVSTKEPTVLGARLQPSRTVATVGAGLVAFGLGMALFFGMRGCGGDPDDEDSALVVRPLPTVAPTDPVGGDNPFVLVEPPSGSLLLGVGDGAPDDATGFRRERQKYAPSIPYEIQQHEVTWKELDPWLGNNPQHRHDPPGWLPTDPAQREKLPATGMPVTTAIAYCESLGARLPSEVEWEYAARGSELRKYPWGSSPVDPSLTHVHKGTEARTRAVMTSPQDRTPGPAQRAIYDMLGNAREWTSDTWIDGKTGAPKGIHDRRYRTVRGLRLGAPDTEPLPAEGLAYRRDMCGEGLCSDRGYQNYRVFLEVWQYIGFRCARDVKR